MKIKGITKKNWGVFDFETDGKKVVYWSLKTNTRITKHGWRGKGEFIRYIKKLCQEKTWYLYAHYSKYDCSFFMREMAGECKVNQNEYRTIKIAWNKINFLDSYLIFPEKLENLPLTEEETIIKRKGRQKIEKKGIRKMSKEEVKKYCDNDVKSLFRLLEDFFKENGEEVIGKASIGSISFYLWKKRHSEQFKWFPNLAKPWYNNIYEFIQPYLMGGFVGMANEAVYKGRAWKYDRNSMYAYIMANELLPIGLPIKHLTYEKHCKSCWNEKTKDYSRPHEIPKFSKERIPFGFVSVEINNLEAKETIKKIPFVAVKSEEYDEFYGEKVLSSYYPLKIQKLEGVFFSEYLKFILRHYTYTEIHFKEVYVFRGEKGIIFEEWIEKYQKLKEKAKKKMEIPSEKNNVSYWNQQYYFAKLMLNCLFGKFGQKKKHRELLWKEGKSPNLGISPTYRKNKKNYHLAYGEEKDGFGFNYVPIASAITSYARIRLVETMLKIGIENVLYWDTDCIVSKVEFPKEWVHPWSIGKWKLEKIYNLFISFAAKAYCGKENKHNSLDWIFKGHGPKPFIDNKVDPTKLLLEGLKEKDKVTAKVTERESWGTNFSKKLIIQRPARENKKMRFIKNGDDYFWLPREQAGHFGTAKEDGKIITFSEKSEND